MSYLLDTNVLSEIWKPQPHPRVLSFLNSVEWFLPVPVIAEIQEGAEASPSASRKVEINARLDRFLERNSAAVIEWDADSARTWGRLKHSPEVKRQPQSFWDSLIDVMAVRHGGTIATRNGKDFHHAKTLNPWESKLPVA